MLKNSSELIEAAGLLERLFDFGKKSEVSVPEYSESYSEVSFDSSISDIVPDISAQTPVKKQTVNKVPVVPKVPMPEITESEFTGDKLDNALARMCVRGGFSTAAILDAEGMVISEYGNELEDFALVAIGSILGQSIDKISKILDTNISSVSADISFTDKLVLRKFSTDTLEFYLILICPQGVDEREEIEVSAGEIISILKI